MAEAVGREYYENGATPGAGYRNGYRRSRLRTAEGAIEYSVLARDHRRRVRTATAESDSRGAGSGLRRARPRGRTIEREWVPRQGIQQGSDLSEPR